MLTLNEVAPGARPYRRKSMTSHPNRNKNAPKLGHVPTGEEITRAREKAGLTQPASAELVYTSLRTWQEWEQGRGRMHPAAFELFLLKTGQSPLGIIRGGTFAPAAAYSSTEAIKGG